MLGNAFLTIRGYSAYETGETFRRAHKICQKIGDNRRIIPILIGLHGFHGIRTEHDKFTIIGQEALELAQGETQHVAPMVTALFLRGVNSVLLGKQRQEAEYFESVDEIYDLDGRKISTYEYGEEPGMCANCAHAWMPAGRCLRSSSIPASALMKPKFVVSRDYSWHSIRVATPRRRRNAS